MASVGSGRHPPEVTGASIGAGCMVSEQDLYFRLQLLVILQKIFAEPCKAAEGTSENDSENDGRERLGRLSVSEIRLKQKRFALFAYLAQKFSDKPPTVPYTLILHTLKKWPLSGYQALVLGTHKETGGADDLQPSGSGNSSRGALVKHYFCCVDNFRQRNHLGFATIEQDKEIRWKRRNKAYLNPGGTADCLCAQTSWIMRHFVPYCLRNY